MWEMRRGAGAKRPRAQPPLPPPPAIAPADFGWPRGPPPIVEDVLSAYVAKRKLLAPIVRGKQASGPGTGNTQIQTQKLGRLGRWAPGNQEAKYAQL